MGKGLKERLFCSSTFGVPFAGSGREKGHIVADSTAVSLCRKLKEVIRGSDCVMYRSVSGDSLSDNLFYSGPPL